MLNELDPVLTVNSEEIQNVTRMLVSLNVLSSKGVNVGAGSSSALQCEPEELAMTTISIKDLPESVALDREAMLAITGGARSGGSPNFSRQPAPGVNRIIGYPTGFAAYAVPNVRGRPGTSKHFK